MNQIWETVKLKAVCAEVQYGYTDSASKEPIGPKFLRITDIVNETIEWDNVPFVKVSEKDFKKYSLEIGDIVVARTGNTTGYAKLIRNTPNAVFASYLIRFKIDEKVAKAGFVGRLIESEIFKTYVWSIAGGAAQPGANASILSEFQFLLPPLPTQRRIASVLTAYDDLIENNLRRIRLLKEVAQRTFEEWFVRFRVGGQPLEIDGGTGLPRGWELKKLAEIAEVNERQVKKGFVGKSTTSTSHRYRWAKLTLRPNSILKKHRAGRGDW